MVPTDWFKYWFRRFGGLIQGQIYDPDILQTYVPTNTLGFSDHRYHNRNNCFLYADTFSLQLYWLLGRGGYNPTIWYRSSVPSTWFQKNKVLCRPEHDGEALFVLKWPLLDWYRIYLAIMLYLCTYNQVIELISEVIKYWFQWTYKWSYK